MYTRIFFYRNKIETIRLSNTRYSPWVDTLTKRSLFFSMCAIYVIYVLSMFSYCFFFETSSKSKLHQNVRRSDKDYLLRYISDISMEQAIKSELHKWKICFG